MTDKDFTDLLDNYIDARSLYKAAVRDDDYENPYQEERYEDFVYYRNALNELVNQLKANCNA